MALIVIGQSIEVNDMYTTNNLLDLEHTLAKDYLSKFNYPWQALSGIKE